MVLYVMRLKEPLGTLICEVPSEKPCVGQQKVEQPDRHLHFCP